MNEWIKAEVNKVNKYMRETELVQAWVLRGHSIVCLISLWCSLRNMLFVCFAVTLEGAISTHCVSWFGLYDSQLPECTTKCRFQQSWVEAWSLNIHYSLNRYHLRTWQFRLWVILERKDLRWWVWVDINPPFFKNGNVSCLLGYNITH